MGDSDAKFAGHIGKVLKVCVYKYCGVIFFSRMFSSKCISPGFSRFLSASTTHVAHSLKGSPAVIMPAVETVQSSPATLTNHSVSKLLPTGNMIATTKHFGESKKKFSSALNIE